MRSPFSGRLQAMKLTSFTGLSPSSREGCCSRLLGVGEDPALGFKDRLVSFQASQVAQYLPANAGDAGHVGLIPGSGRRKCQPTPVFLPGESQGQRSLVGYSPRVAESGMTE